MSSMKEEKGGYKIRWCEGKKRPVLQLGHISKTNAERTKVHVDHLIEAKKTGERPPASVRKWVNSLPSGRLRDRLVELGLAKPRLRGGDSDADKYLDAFIDRWIDDRYPEKTGEKQTTTRRNHKQSRNKLVDYFVERGKRRLDSITAGDLETWQSQLDHATSTANRFVQHTKKWFKAAVNAELIERSPAEDLKEKSLSPKEKSNQKKKKGYSLDPALNQEVLDGLVGEDRLVYVLARYQALRRCEIWYLEWSHINWGPERARMEVSEDGKTGYRELPIFAETMPYLREAFEQAEDGATRAITKFRKLDSMTAQMGNVIKQVVGESRMWPDVLRTLRRVRRNELARKLPAHAVKEWVGMDDHAPGGFGGEQMVNEWMGHDAATANAFYLGVTDDDWRLATGSTVHCDPSGGRASRAVVTPVVTRRRPPKKIGTLTIQKTPQPRLSLLRWSCLV